MIATAIIPALPVALLPAGLMPVAFGLAVLAVGFGFAALVASIARDDDRTSGRATRSANVPSLPTPLSLPRAA
jgi:hypothetical protein